MGHLITLLASREPSDGGHEAEHAESAAELAEQMPLGEGEAFPKAPCSRFYKHWGSLKGL